MSTVGAYDRYEGDKDASLLSIPSVYSPVSNANVTSHIKNSISLTNHFGSFDNKLSQKATKCTILLMTAIVITGPLSTESQVPALHNISTDFDTTSYLVQLSITI